MGMCRNWSSLWQSGVWWCLWAGLGDTVWHGSNALGGKAGRRKLEDTGLSAPSPGKTSCFPNSNWPCTGDTQAAIYCCYKMCGCASQTGLDLVFGCLLFLSILSLSLSMGRNVKWYKAARSHLKSREWQWEIVLVQGGGEPLPWKLWNTEERNRRRGEKMEGPPVSLDMQQCHHQNGRVTKSIRHIQCDPHQNTTGILHRTRKHSSKINLEE